MSSERLDRVLDAAYLCFTRHGVRRTTMDDIAAAAGMSRPAVYQHVRNKDDAFRHLAERLYDAAAARATAAGRVEASLTDRLAGVLGAKLDLTLRLWHDSPHAAELLGTNARVSADLDARFVARMRELVADVVRPAAGDGAVEFAELALALTRGLEADLTDPDAPRRRLRAGIGLLVAGLPPRDGTTATTPRHGSAATTPRHGSAATTPRDSTA